MAGYDNRNMSQPSGYARSGDAALDAGLRAYMLRVYNYMALGVAGTALFTLVLMNNPDTMRAIAMGPMKWVLFAGILGLGFFAQKIFYSGSVLVAHGAYWLYAAMWGALISPMLYAFFTNGASGLVFQAFLLAALTFGGTSLYGFVTKRDMTGWGGFLAMASIGLIVVSLVTFFFISDPGTSKTVSFVISSVVVLLFAAITAWETQQIKAMYLEGAAEGGEEFTSRSAIFGSFMLYGSFVTLFTHILNILGLSSDD
jgi:uncharacterized protein